MQLFRIIQFDNLNRLKEVFSAKYFDPVYELSYFHVPGVKKSMTSIWTAEKSFEILNDIIEKFEECDPNSHKYAYEYFDGVITFFWVI